MIPCSLTQRPKVTRCAVDPAGLGPWCVRPCVEKGSKAGWARLVEGSGCQTHSQCANRTCVPLRVEKATLEQAGPVRFCASLGSSWVWSRKERAYRGRG